MLTTSQEHSMTRSVDTGRRLTASTGQFSDDRGDGQSIVQRFCELPVGATFRMVAGRWPMIKISLTGAARQHALVDASLLELEHDFEGWERCVLLSQRESRLYLVTDSQSKTSEAKGADTDEGKRG